MRKAFLSGLAGAACALALAGSAAAAEHNWKMQTEWGGGPLMELGAKAFADDYANMARAALQLYEVSGEKHFLERARAWVDTLDAHYWDDERGSYYYTADSTQSPVLRPRFHADSPAAPANATMMGVLSRLILITGEQKYAERAPRLLRAFAGEAGRSFPGMAAYLNGAETYSMALQVVVFGARGNAQTQELIRTVWGGGYTLAAEVTRL